METQVTRMVKRTRLQVKLESLDEPRGVKEVEVELPEEFASKHSNAFNEACKFILKQDPTLLEIITSYEFPSFLKSETHANAGLQYYYSKLASSIIAQQISGSAAKSIKNKLQSLYGGKFPTYQDIHQDLKDDAKKENIKVCGFSARKMSYLESLTSYFFNNEADILEMFAKEDNDEELIENLVSSIKGIGRWSAKMFLMAGLRRWDVFASEDLGIARGTSKYLSQRPDLVLKLTQARKVVKKSKIKHKTLKWKVYDDDIVEACAESFAPYRTIFMYILWRLSDTNVEALVRMEKEFIGN